MTRYRVRVYRRGTRLWTPGTDFVGETLKLYRDLLKPGDIVAFSEKALAVSLGLIYDESLVKASVIDSVFTYLIKNVLWLHLLKVFFEKRESISLLEKTPLELLAKHKKTIARLCGPLYILKPFSECGVDATNLPYQYVSLPLKNPCRIAYEVKSAIESKVGFTVNVLVVDSDLCFKPKGVKNLVIATRQSCVRGVVNLGWIGYLVCKVLFRRMFYEFPTPVSYAGFWLGLEALLKISRAADKAFGPGLGVTLDEASRRAGAGLTSLGWRELYRYKHYPVVVVRVRKSL